MQNFSQPGRIIEIVPETPVTSGQFLIVRSLCGVTVTAAPAGATVGLAVEGTFALPKLPAASVLIGDPILWDRAEKLCRLDGNDETVLIGAAAEDAGAGQTQVYVRLNGVTL